MPTYGGFVKRAWCDPRGRLRGSVKRGGEEGGGACPTLRWLDEYHDHRVLT